MVKTVRALLAQPAVDRLDRGFAERIDPFGDDRGLERWGVLLALWLSAIRQRGCADDALPIVVDRYRALYGEDKVLCLNAYNER